MAIHIPPPTFSHKPPNLGVKVPPSPLYTPPSSNCKTKRKKVIKRIIRVKKNHPHFSIQHNIYYCTHKKKKLCKRFYYEKKIIMKLVFIVIHMRKVLYHVTIKNNLLNYNEKNTQQNKMMGRKSL